VARIETPARRFETFVFIWGTGLFCSGRESDRTRGFRAMPSRLLGASRTTKKSTYFDNYSVFADSKALFVQGGLHFAFLMDERRISKDGLAPNFFGETYR
jgi:hypothetical protein